VARQGDANHYTEAILVNKDHYQQLKRTSSKGNATPWSVLSLFPVPLRVNSGSYTGVLNTMHPIAPSKQGILGHPCVFSFLCYATSAKSEYMVIYSIDHYTGPSFEYVTILFPFPCHSSSESIGIEALGLLGKLETRTQRLGEVSWSYCFDDEY